MAATKHYTRVEPEVGGGFGPDVDFDRNREPRMVGTFQYEFDGWLGDDIVEAVGFWIITNQVAGALRASPLTGYDLRPAEAIEGDQYEILHHDRPLPDDWEWLEPTGEHGVDDFVREGRTKLLVSDAALALLQQFQLDHADLSDADEPAPVSEILQKFLATRPKPDAQG